jgi:hypothetical protein
MGAATLPLAHADSTAADTTFNFSQARFAFRQLEAWLTADDSASASEAQVEEQLERRGRELLRLLLQAHLRQRGTGSVGPALRVFSPPAAADGSADARPQPPRPGGVRHVKFRGSRLASLAREAAAGYKSTHGGSHCVDPVLHAQAGACLGTP